MRIRMIVLPLIALGIGVFYWQTAPDTDVPACTWRIGTGTEIRQGSNYEELAPESSIRLSVRLNRPRHVYVFSHSVEDGTLLLFPSPGLKSDCSNPLPAGRTVLPGKTVGPDSIAAAPVGPSPNGPNSKGPASKGPDSQGPASQGPGPAGQPITWTTRSGIEAVTTFMVVASEEPIASLEALLPRMRHWSNRVFPDQTLSVTQTAVDTDIVGRPRQPIPSPLLRAAAAIGSTDASPNGPMKPANSFEGVFTASWKIRENKAARPAKPSMPVLPTIPQLMGKQPQTDGKPRPAGK